MSAHENIKIIYKKSSIKIYNKCEIFKDSYNKIKIFKTILILNEKNLLFYFIHIIKQE